MKTPKMRGQARGLRAGTVFVFLQLLLSYTVAMRALALDHTARGQCSMQCCTVQTAQIKISQSTEQTHRQALRANTTCWNTTIEHTRPPSTNTTRQEITHEQPYQNDSVSRNRFTDRCGSSMAGARTVVLGSGSLPPPDSKRPVELQSGVVAGGERRWQQPDSSPRTNSAARPPPRSH